MPYKDKEKQRAAWNAYYDRNKDRLREDRAARRDEAKLRNKQFVLDYLLTHPCVDCDEADPVVLEFDHLGDKEVDISALLSNGSSLSRIKKEIAKCEVVCANCHRRRTAKRGNHFRFASMASIG